MAVEQQEGCFWKSNVLISSNMEGSTHKDCTDMEGVGAEEVEEVAALKDSLRCRWEVGEGNLEDSVGATEGTDKQPL